MIKAFAVLFGIIMGGCLASCSRQSHAENLTGVQVPEPAHRAEFTDDGALKLPANLDQWVFIGSSLGMGYSDVAFNPGSPGNFQIVTMEPTAYSEFMRTGLFPDGSMFALAFYGAQTDISINQTGFVMGDQRMIEIHLKDSTRFPETGFNFYMFHPGQMTADSRQLPNNCVTCHMQHAAHDGVFTQFYPVIRDRLEKAEHP